jgi:hypothetical protein
MPATARVLAKHSPCPASFEGSPPGANLPRYWGRSPFHAGRAGTRRRAPSVPRRCCKCPATVLGPLPVHAGRAGTKAPCAEPERLQSYCGLPWWRCFAPTTPLLWCGGSCGALGTRCCLPPGYSAPGGRGSPRVHAALGPAPCAAARTALAAPGLGAVRRCRCRTEVLGRPLPRRCCPRVPAEGSAAPRARTPCLPAVLPAVVSRAPAGGGRRHTPEPLLDLPRHEASTSARCRASSAPPSWCPPCTPSSRQACASAPARCCPSLASALVSCQRLARRPLDGCVPRRRLAAARRRRRLPAARLAPRPRDVRMPRRQLSAARRRRRLQAARPARRPRGGRVTRRRLAAARRRGRHRLQAARLAPRPRDGRAPRNQLAAARRRRRRRLHAAR